MLSNKKLNPIVTELFIRSRKINVFLLFITQSYIVVPKHIKLNFTHFFIVKVSNKRELASHISSDINFNDFMSY